MQGATESDPEGAMTSPGGNENAMRLDQYDSDSANAEEALPLVAVLSPPGESWTPTEGSPEIDIDRDGCCSLLTRITRNARVVAGFLLVVMAILGMMGTTRSSDGSLEGRSSAKVATVKLFDVNAPPETEIREEMRLRPLQHQHENVFRLTNTPEDDDDAITDAKALPFPIIQADDDIPISKSSLAEHAADALMCRDSVLNFVINATDAKDECEGLKKAFDMTCNSDSAQEIRASSDPARASSDPALASSDPARASSDPAHLQRRRLVFATNKNGRGGWKLQMHQFVRSLRKFATYMFPSNDDHFFAEDEVVGEAWEEARFQVTNDFDSLVHEETRRRISGIHYDVAAPGETTRRMEFLTSNDEAKQNVTDEDISTLKAKPIEKKTLKPKNSLSLPTSSQHVSEQMLSETLMLTKEKDIEAVIKASSNQTNATFNEAQTDAMASSKAVQDTTAAISAVLNDPDSVEARTCCSSILNVYHEHCDTTDGNEVSDSNLFIIVFIIAFCGVVKSLIRHFRIRWLPEAAGCILVGVLIGAIVSFTPHYDLSFNGEWFLRIMVPPIVFEAALSIDKRSFQKHLVPIIIYAIAGTLMATALTAYILHKGTSILGSLCGTIPYVDSLTFGALISSIDPIAVLSVLSNLGMTDTDTIYVVIFGESLLNDGVAIVLFQTLVHFLDDSLVIDGEACTLAAIHFLVVALGSVLVGFLSGMGCTCYFYVMQGCQTPLVEVLMFFCWAFIPYYICDGIEWSGIVAIVTTGIIMDLYVVGQSNQEEGGTDLSPANGNSVERVSQRKSDRKTLRQKILSRNGHLSSIAKTHVGFVTEILATMMETAIFAYLGFFLFSYRYHWNFWHVSMSILACCLSRAIMIPLLSFFANWITSMQQAQARSNCRAAIRRTGQNVAQGGVIIDSRMQTILWFAGLRGAMSFALVENIPLYDAVTGEGSRMKAELKAMTSACIIFTVFVLGGCTDYVIERMGMTPAKKTETVEMTSLLSLAVGSRDETDVGHSEDAKLKTPPKPVMFRQRGSRV